MNKMQIIIEEGVTGLWYGIGSPPYHGLLACGRSLDEVLDKLSPAIKDMRTAMQDLQEKIVAEAKTSNDPNCSKAT